MQLRRFAGVGVGLVISAGLGVTGAGAQQARTTICHVPPGNPGNGQTLSLPPGAVDAHLRNHPFDHLGPCVGNEPTPAAAGFVDVDDAAFETAGFFAPSANASGGNGGSARGGEGGRGGTGTLPICNQNSNDVTWTEYWDADGNLVSDEPTVDCGAGGRGGTAGDAGISEGGDGGLAFAIAFG
jgi:hypothetical protein